MKKKVYLAGAMACYGKDDTTAKDWRNQAKRWFKDQTDNFKVISPTDYYEYGNTFHQTEKEVMRFDLRKVKEADVVLVNLNDLSKSLGTSDEILFAYLNNIPIIGFLKPKVYVYNSSEVYNVDEEIAQLHPWKREQLDRIECAHDGMVKALVEGLDEGQQKILVKSLLNLRTFFDSYKKD